MTHSLLLSELNQSLATIKAKLGEHGEKICANEIAEIRAKLDRLAALTATQKNQPSSEEVELLTELIATIEKMIMEIDKEVTELAAHVHEQGDGSMTHAHKSHFRSALQELIDRIRVDLPYI